MTPLRVLVAKGGASLEREVSLKGALRVSHALQHAGHRVESLDVADTFVEQARTLGCDFVFIAMHGKGGEDGTLQDLLEIMRLPYTGSDSLASSICMDKVLFKRLLRARGLPTPAFHSFNEEALKTMGAADTFDDLIEEVGLPLVVKPVAQGSSIGIKFARERRELVPAVLGAFAYDDRILVERHVAGRELAVTVLGPPDAPEPLPVVEIRSRTGYFSYEAHYEVGAADFLVPAPLEAVERRRVQEVAVQAYATVGCRDFARVDLILDEDGEPQVLEINTIPGLTETGLTPLAASEAELTFEELIARVSARAAGEASGRVAPATGG